MARRNVRKRLVVGGSAVVLLIAWYFASVPLVFEIAKSVAPGAIPSLRTFYTPTESYATNEKLPGSSLYGTYLGTTGRIVRETLNPFDAQKTLQQPTAAEFRKTPLREVLEYMSEVHGMALELGASADGSTRVTISSTGTVEKVLKEILEPHALVAVPSGDRIVIQTQQAIEEQAKKADAATAAHARMVRLVIAALAVITALFVWRVWRSSRKHQDSV